MNTKWKAKYGMLKGRQRGFSLLDVLLGIVIFAVGMLALAHMQTNVSRSSSDANTRTVATNIGEEILEELLAYRRVTTDPDGVDLAFADIDAGYISRPVERGGLEFTTSGTVIGYTFDADGVGVTATSPAVAGTVYDFKMVELTVSWDNALGFLIDEDNQISSADMNTGSITLKKIVPSIPSLGSAKVAANDDGEGDAIPVIYSPGEIPDIVPIELVDGSISKESTDPMPDVIRQDETVETWFDVITYNQSNPNQFLRREEFLVVACECTLRASGGSTSGFEPTVWNGESYTEGEFVAKQYGEETNLAQSFYCSTCCRDHHDGSSSAADRVYDPRKDWTSGASGGNHYHYGRDNRGVLDTDPAGVGDDYAEVCRMVRKDGFMRVAQDFRQEGLHVIPQSHFESLTNVDNYSSYVTSALDQYLAEYLGGLSTPSLQTASDYGLTLPGDADAKRIAMAQVGGPDGGIPSEAQMVSRAVYIDHFSAEAADIIDCMAPASLGGLGNDAETCGVTPGLTYREVVPFFEVQLTWLSWWDENSDGDPITVTNDALEDDNTHSRGYTDVVSANVANVTVSTDVHRGNVGISATDPIDHLHYSAGTTSAYALLAVNGGGVVPPPTGVEFSGSIRSAVGGVSASSVSLTGSSGVICTLTVENIDCTIDYAATSPTLTISGYWKNAQTDLYVCDETGDYPIIGTSEQSSPKSTTFNLIAAAGSGETSASFVIQDTPCT